jgi:hypothetical protein
MNLCLFLKCINSDFKSFSSAWFDMRSICFILCNNMHIYRSVSVIVNASNWAPGVTGKGHGMEKTGGGRTITPQKSQLAVWGTEPRDAGTLVGIYKHVCHNTNISTAIPWDIGYILWGNTYDKYKAIKRNSTKTMKDTAMQTAVTITVMRGFCGKYFSVFQINFLHIFSAFWLCSALCCTVCVQCSLTVLHSLCPVQSDCAAQFVSSAVWLCCTVCVQCSLTVLHSLCPVQSYCAQLMYCTIPVAHALFVTWRQIGL